MKITINVMKRHLYVLILLVSVFLIVTFAIAGTYANPTTKVGHDGDEVQVTVNGQAKVLNNILEDMSKNTNILVRHSQTALEPGCPLGWKDLWGGFSFVGAALGANLDSGQDLGSSGSCLESFNPSNIIECGGSGNPKYCDYWTGDDHQAWLSTLNTDEGGVSDTPPFNTLKLKISRCTVCEKSSPVLVRHSLTRFEPGCPSGWARLWGGFSLKTIYLAGGYTFPQDLGGTGSCLEIFRPLPHIECTPRWCDYATGGDYSMWLTTLDLDEGGVTSEHPFDGLKPKISRCVVCSK